jgi:hypothetical protein
MVDVRHSLLCAALVAILGASLTVAADARHRKPVRHPAVQASEIDYDGTPIIMKDFPRPKKSKTAVLPSVTSPVVVPPPYTSPRDLPPRQLLQAPPPATVARPATPSFSDRVTSCIHSFPLNAGIGHNPTDRDSYVRQCAN